MKKKFLYELYLSIFNHLFNHLPSYTFRHFLYKRVGKMKIGNKTNIQMGMKIYKPWGIEVGRNTVINNNVVLDGRGKLLIGDNVNISPYVKIYTAEHDVNGSLFDYVEAMVRIEDYAWVSTGSIVLPGVTIGKGAVVASGAVVSKDVDPFTIVGGVPAKKIGTRSTNLNYSLNYRKYFH
ncbi:acyltransferase [Terribacillus saccharophilus]|nr:acyltransferase [Terribacillus saccharophilus]